MATLDETLHSKQIGAEVICIETDTSSEGSETGDDVSDVQNDISAENSELRDPETNHLSKPYSLAASFETDLPEEHTSKASFTLPSLRLDLGRGKECPEALERITQNPHLTASAYLNTILLSSDRKLATQMKIPFALMITERAIENIIEVLQRKQGSHPDAHEQNTSSTMIHQALDQAVPYFEWQGSSNVRGRVQYLMVLLEELYKATGVEMDLLRPMLNADPANFKAFDQLAEIVAELNIDYKSLLGPWGAELFEVALRVPWRGERKSEHIFLSGVSKRGRSIDGEGSGAVGMSPEKRSRVA